MSGQGDSLDNSSDDRPNPFGLARSLENAYYSRDVESLRRIAFQAEQLIRLLEARVRQLEGASSPSARLP